MAFKKLVKCPICRVPNRFGEKRCKICKNDLPQDEAVREAPDRVKKQQESARPPKKREQPHPRSHTRSRIKPLDPAARRTRPPKRRPPDDERRKKRPPKPQPKAKRKAPKKEQSERSKTIAWLCCDPLPPIPLGPKPTLTLGRSDECDLVLPHKEVSRVHALIKVRGTMLVYEDEGSSNGTYINGKRVSTAHLKVGDQLTLGPYEIDIRSNEEMAARGNTTVQTKAFVLTSRRGNRTAAMEGNLREIPLSELLQALEFNKRSGTLTIFTKKLKGTLVLAEGRPITASFGRLSDAAAILAMLTFRAGRFSLDGDAVDMEPTMEDSLTSLLFEASRQEDEEARKAAEDQD